MLSAKRDTCPSLIYNYSEPIRVKRLQVYTSSLVIYFNLVSFCNRIGSGDNCRTIGICSPAPTKSLTKHGRSRDLLST